MKTHSVSSQNFTAGKIKFIPAKNMKGTFDDLRSILEPKMDEILPNLENMISSKPYDLFISRAEGMHGFYSVDANTDFANVLNSNPARKGRPSLVYENRLGRFTAAAHEAMQSFEQVADYKELIKPEGFFKTIWKILFNKH